VIAMPTYVVSLINAVSAIVEVEADTPEEAIDLAYDSPDMPGSITINAFGSASVDDGDWEPHSVHDADGKTVWKADD
jgi:hypothetical protein